MAKLCAPSRLGLREVLPREEIAFQGTLQMACSVTSLVIEPYQPLFSSQPLHSPQNDHAKLGPLQWSQSQT